jgi:hypothetical protein
VSVKQRRAENQRYINHPMNLFDSHVVYCTVLMEFVYDGRNPCETNTIMNVIELMCSSANAVRYIDSLGWTIISPSPGRDQQCACLQGRPGAQPDELANPLIRDNLSTSHLRHSCWHLVIHFSSPVAARPPILAPCATLLSTDPTGPPHHHPPFAGWTHEVYR